MTSRIIVKGLPISFTAEQLKEHFSSKGEVTDAKIAKTSSGKSRQFGFVGYKTKEDALEAMKYFNKSFIRTARIFVELAKKVGDPSIQRPWSKYSKPPVSEENKNIKLEPGTGNQASDFLDKKKKHLAAVGILEDDPSLKEFLQIMKPRSQMKTWENDDILPHHNVVDSNISIPSVQVAKSADDDLYEDMPTLRHAENNTPDEVDHTEEHDTEDPRIVSTSQIPNVIVEQEEKEEMDENLQLLAETGRLFVRNLGFSTTEQELKTLFEPYGPTSEVYIPIDFETKNPKGIAFVSFMIPEHAVVAFSELDGTIFQGRLLHLIPSREKRIVELPDNATFKAKKSAKLRSQASDEKTWNTLFMSPDAVAASMATKLNVSKSDILNPDADNMAVRLALAETHVIEETIRYLGDEGVCVDSFKMNMKKERSDSVILVKNVPFEVNKNDLMEAFSRHGDVLRLVLPPTKTIALIEYASNNEAKAAFKHLAYKNFHGKPLLLEMAPVGVFNQAAVKEKKKDILENEEDAETESATLFVKNLNFSSTNDSLANIFQTVDGFRSAKISMKRDIKTGNMKSMGFGFAEFSSVESAKNAIKVYQNVMLDGHALQLKFSDRATTSKSSAGSFGKEIKAKGTKLLVKNVAFEATKKDITELFSTFGQLKSVKLPKKFDNKSHRGFAFVSFLTKQEAKNAFESLASTHLYGRHLVIEWAEDDESIDALREKTKRMYNAIQADDGTKSKKIKLPEDGDLEGDEEDE